MECATRQQQGSVCSASAAQEEQQQRRLTEREDQVSTAGMSARLALVSPFLSLQATLHSGNRFGSRSYSIDRRLLSSRRS